MSIEETIKRRRSVFPAQFSGEKIDNLYINHLLELANWAPTHIHTEPWRFQVFHGESLKSLMEKLAELYKLHTPRDKFSEAKFQKYAHRLELVSHVISVSVHYDQEHRLPRIEESNAVACAVQNIWLAITESEDVRGYWSSGSLVYKEEFAKWMGLTQNEACLGLFYLGKLKKSAPESAAIRSPWQNKVEWRN
jgi:nitroreductase